MRFGALYLSALLLIDALAGVAFAVPSVVVLTAKHPTTAALLLLLGVNGSPRRACCRLLIFPLRAANSLRPLKVTVFEEHRQDFRLNAVMKCVLRSKYLQNYLTRYSEEFTRIFAKYSVVFPFSTALIFEVEETCFCSLVILRHFCCCSILRRAGFSEAFWSRNSFLGVATCGVKELRDAGSSKLLAMGFSDDAEGLENNFQADFDGCRVFNPDLLHPAAGFRFVALRSGGKSSF